MLKRLQAVIFGLTLCVTFSLGLGQAAHAQSQANSPIVSGLCEGANLHITETPATSCQSSGESITTRFNNFLKGLINIFSAIIGIVAVLMIIFGGFRYITSGGNDTSVTSAKNTILYAIIGLIIVALAQLLVHFVLRLAA